MTTRQVWVEYIKRDEPDGAIWLDVHVEGKPYDSVGPFESAGERQRALDDLLNMMRSVGAKDAAPGVN